MDYAANIQNFSIWGEKKQHPLKKKNGARKCLSHTAPTPAKFGHSHIVPIYFSYTSYITYIRSI